MANGLAPYYLLQTAFTAGEISPEVANRVDLDKYQFALLTARNCLVRPYGPTYKRTGLKFCNAAKFTDKKCMLVEFAFSDTVNYLLEIGAGYIRVYKNGEYLNAEMVTPFEESDLPDLRFTQSADVMFITSGRFPVKQLARYSETDWRLTDFEITHMYFDESLVPDTDSNVKMFDEPGTFTFTTPKEGTYMVSVAGAGGGAGGGGHVSHGHHYLGGSGGRGELVSQKVSLTENQQITIVVGDGGEPGAVGNYSPNAESGEDGEASKFGNAITAKGGSGGHHAKQMNGSYYDNGADGTSYGNGGMGGAKSPSWNVKGAKGNPGWVSVAYSGAVTVTPSATKGEVTLTASGSLFSAKSVGSSIMLRQEVPAAEVNTSNGTSDSIKVGESWKVISHGTWTGTFEIQKSKDNANWESYRKYSGKNDFNPSESGTVTDEVYLRVVCEITSGTCNVSLTAALYEKKGVATITEYVSATEVKALVDEDFASTTPTEDYLFGSWSEEFGYPRTVCFFQDRLCFGGTEKQPYMVWMSRSGDYPNFEVEEADGTVTDDSAIAAAFVSRKQFRILHLVPSSDLMILSEGNEWIVSGADVVTPKNITPKMQTTHGCNNCEPQMIGGRLVYVQGRGSVVRDMGYSFETDSYGGMDLTLLAKHITRGVEITDIAYQQNPDSIVYFVLSDGTLAALSYIREQEVYAWSRLETEGMVESVACVGEGDVDAVYVAVRRTVDGKEKRFIERFADLVESDTPDDYVMLDSSLTFNFNALDGKAAEGLESLTAAHLPNTKVDVLGDGRMFKNLQTDETGTVKLPGKVKRAVLGLPYTMKLELPNVEIKTGDGTMQGRHKQVSACTLRVQNSLGGEVGADFKVMDRVQYDELSAVKDIKLYSGDKKMVLPIGGFNLEGRVCITNDDPYPFNLLAVIREVSFDG